MPVEIKVSFPSKEIFVTNSVFVSIADATLLYLFLKDFKKFRLFRSHAEQNQEIFFFLQYRSIILNSDFSNSIFFYN